MNARDFVAHYGAILFQRCVDAGVDHRHRSCAMIDLSCAVAEAINAGCSIGDLSVLIESDGPGHVRVLVYASAPYSEDPSHEVH